MRARRSTVCVAVACIACGCSFGITSTRFPEKENPTTFVYDRSLSSVVECFRAGLVGDAWGGKANVGQHPNVTQVAGQSYELTLESQGYGPGVLRSESYLHHSCPVGIYGQWRFKLVAQSSAQTKVEVRPISLLAHDYDCVMMSHPWGCAIPVKSTTVEEYTMLVSLGRCLDVPMPPIVHAGSERPATTTCDDPKVIDVPDS